MSCTRSGFGHQKTYTHLFFVIFITSHCVLSRFDSNFDTLYEVWSPNSIEFWWGFGRSTKKNDNYDHDNYENGKWGKFSVIPENFQFLSGIDKFLEILPIYCIFWPLSANYSKIPTHLGGVIYQMGRSVLKYKTNKTMWLSWSRQMRGRETL